MLTLDLLGALLSLTCTYAFTKNWWQAWILSFCAIVINGYLYWQKAIYGSVFLELFYLVSSLYGLYYWSQIKQIGQPVYRLSQRQYQCLGTGGLVAFSVAVFLLEKTGSTIVYIDAAITVLSLIAQGLLCRRFLETWVLWLVVDVMVAVLQFQKAIPFHALVHVLYIGLAIKGFIRWRTYYRQQANNAPPQLFLT